MNNYYKFSHIYEIDLYDCFWKLLMQWKAVLIICLTMALLVPGVIYIRDSRDYEDAIAEKEKAAKEASLPNEDRIEAILKTLPQNEVSDVQYIVQMQKTLDHQKEYYNNSIWLNANPTRQRNLNIKFYLQKKDVSDMQALVDAYISFLREARVMKPLRDVIAPDASLDYIYELFSAYGGNIADSDVDSTIFTVNLVLPEDSDADAIIRIIDSNIRRINKELKDSLGDNSIKRIHSEDYYVYSSAPADRRTNLSYSIYNLSYDIDTFKKNLNEEQMKAMDAILAINSINSAADEVPQEDSNQDSPSFSKVYCVLGFLMGAFLYTLVFLLILVLKKPVYSASIAQSCTGKRLLGELYSVNDHKGIKKLFTSKSIAKRHYKSKLDIDHQTGAAAATIDAVCSHNGINALSILMKGVPDGFQNAIEMLADKCGSGDCKIKLDLIDVDRMNEKELSGINNAVFALGNKSIVDEADNLSKLCRDYEVTLIGTVFMESI